MADVKTFCSGKRQQGKTAWSTRMKRLSIKFLVPVIIMLVMEIPTIYILKECGHPRAHLWWNKIVELEQRWTDKQAYIFGIKYEKSCYFLNAIVHN